MNVGLFIAGAIVTLIVSGAIALLLTGAVIDGRTQDDAASSEPGRNGAAASREAAERAVATHAADSR